MAAVNNEGRKSKTLRQDRQLIAILFLVTLSLLTLTGPQYVRNLTYMIFTPATPEAYGFYYFFVQLTNKLTTMNSAVNFYLYCISGSKFRKEVLALLSCASKSAVESSQPQSSSTRTATVHPISS